MYQNKITLTTQEILEKEFKVDVRGFCCKEVDQFLDVVIEDYNQFYKIIDSLEKEKNELIVENVKLKQDLRNSRISVEVASNTKAGEVTNVDVIRRLSQLEKMVYGAKQAEKESVDKENKEEN